ncbi:exodeoxyribonuclease VII small subunit [Pseudoflavitalea sp. X16]|uniref:exodeoxyribonuclease VII small subunit n=1 Tax=Paraflavitalea devenefica TaxID=2716334 RepID=UPI0014214A20|nr:exodeoxyribonuclease VII small subunit [Paraflavitalea devenefica]NII25707.1 exodeoxyribonuclease VII small subunit [Paraflavitalea devenefica]
MKEALTYEAAYEELKEIAADIEAETVSVDVLAEKLKRASFLLEFCKARLKSTEQEVSNIIQQMNKDTDEPD